MAKHMADMKQPAPDDEAQAKAEGEVEPAQQPELEDADATQLIPADGELADEVAEAEGIASDETTPLPDDETVLLAEDKTTLAPEDETRLISEETTELPPDDEEETQLVPDEGHFDRIDETELMPTPIEEDASDPRVQTMRMIPATGDALYDEEAKEQKKKSHHRLIAVFLLMIVLISAAAAFVSYGAELWGGKTVPNVVGRGQDAATSTLEGKGFQVAVEEVPSDEKIGKVISQSPKAGERLDEGKTVTIQVAVARVMPDVAGTSLEDAEQTLRDAGAKDLVTSYVASDQPAGTVLGTQPEAGATFTSQDTITIIIAQAYSVPDLVGQKESDAVAALESLGLTAKVTYRESDKDDHLVLSTNPAAGSEIAQGAEVELVVSQPYPSDIHQLADYATHAPADISKWIGDKGFSCKGGIIDSAGYAATTYSDGNATISLTSTPFVNAIDFSQGDQGDVLAKGTWFQGVRYEFGADEQPSSASSLSDAAVREAMATCGLDNMVDTCTQDSVVLPAPATAEGHRFICAYGEMGDNCWTVLIEATGGGSRTVVTYAPKSVYDAANLDATGGRICDYVAYMYLYS